MCASSFHFWQEPLKAGERDAVVRLLNQGECIAMPTETVYGLCADATNEQAVRGVFEAKNRPLNNPLIAHIWSLEAALCHGIFHEAALRLARAFWPGALTLVVPHKKASPITQLARAGLASIALRYPKAKTLCAIAEAINAPLAAPSANLSSRLSPTSAAAVREQLEGRICGVIDGGDCYIGIESTVVDCRDDMLRILRPGAISAEQITHATGLCFSHNAEGAHTVSGVAFPSPGQMPLHYAPQTPVRLNADEVLAGETLLSFGSKHPKGHQDAVQIYHLSPSGDLHEAAHNLYAGLRALDALESCAIAVARIPNEGIGEAINDRLRRAANA